MITGQPAAITSPPINNHIQQVPPQQPANHVFSSVPQGVPLSYVIHRLIEQSYTNLLQLSESLVDKSDEQRKKTLVKYLEGSRERFIRLLVLVKWAHYLPNLTNAANIINFLNQQDFFLRDAADSLCHLHTRLYTARAPGYDIPTAIDVLTTGTYQRLPTVIHQTAKKAPLSDQEVASTIQRLDDLLCFRLLSSSVPKQFTSVTVANGRVILTVSDEYTVHLTVNGEEMSDPWQVLSLHLLLRPHSHKEKGTGTDVIMADKEEDGVLPAVHIRRVIDVLTLRMAESGNPLVEMHTIVHHLVVTLMMDILRTQAQSLKILAPTPPVPAGQVGAVPPPLVVNYWTDNATRPSLKIRIDPATTNLVIEHHPVIVDPLTGTEPQFKLVPTAISIENLLMQATRHHARSRIFALAQRMVAHPMLAHCVDTKDRDYVSVTLFGGWRLVIGVDYTSGRFIARDSSLPADLISNLEDSFNAEPTSIPDSASQLRIRAAVCYIERITHAIPLEAFRTLPIYSQNIPTSSSSSSTSTSTINTLYLRYPTIEANVHYHLCITVAPNLVPTFALVRVNTTIPTQSTNNNTLIASTGESNPQQSVYPIQMTVKQPITEKTYDKAVGGAISIGAQRRAYLMIVSELSALSFPHQIFMKKKPGTTKDNSYSEVGIQVSLPEPLPFPPVLLPSLPRTPPFTSFSLTPIYFPQDHPFLPSPSHMGWQISAKETNPRTSTTTGYKTITYGKGYGEVSCTNDLWTFTYNILSASAPENGRPINRPAGAVNRAVNKRDPAAESIALRLFVQDVHGVAAIREIHTAIEKIVLNSDLASFFTIHAVGPTAIHILSHGEGFTECTTSIEWKGAAGITVDFSPTMNPFSPYLQRILTSAPAADSSRYQPIVSFLLHVRHSLELVHHVAQYLDHPAIPSLPGDIVIIPRSGNLLRVVYRNTYGIDFRISHAGIQMEDAGEPGPYSGLAVSSRERIPQQKITNFAQFMEEKRAMLGNPIQPSSVPAALRAIHSYMGVLWLLRASIRIFTELTEPTPGTNPANPSTAPILPSNVKTEPQLQRLTLKGTMHGVQYTFMITHHETFELYPAPLTPATAAAPNKYMDQGLLPNAFGLTLPEAEAISKFWRENVASPPYRPTSLISFIRILALPIVPLKEFAEIMMMSQRQQDREAERVTLCLSHTVGSKHRDAVLHLAATSEINFILRFVPPHNATATPSHQPLSSSISSLALSSAAVRPAEPHSTTMEMGLRYQYTTHGLRVWGGVSGGGAEEDAAHADMLERAIARARMSEPEHSVSGGMLPIPTLPAVVRALLFLRNPSSVP
eukprot:Phypoly_transcript_00777.p1 GENE.Phypoly_transcript_00777~~Phypoly_transcript_00777.p1  ORF type:complete len:1315 (+),score=237.69 Phypoly_transcript_00777:105-4049(+)